MHDDTHMTCSLFLCSYLLLTDACAEQMLQVAFFTNRQVNAKEELTWVWFVFEVFALLLRDECSYNLLIL